MKAEEYIHSIYYDPTHPASFSGPAKLHREIKKKGYTLSLAKVKEWLKGEETYTLHRPLRRKFKRNKVYVPRIDHQWDADLMDMSQISTYNDGVTFVLLAIDIFSRYVWTAPLKTKQGSEAIKAFEVMFAERKPQTLRTDKGGEFTGGKIQSFFKQHGVHHFVTQNEEIKANYAERAIKTIKMKIYKYFTYKQTYRYIDVLEAFTDAYNHSFHRTIKMAPAHVNKENEQKVHDTQYNPNVSSTKAPKYKYNVDDSVRISHRKKVFTREYHEKWSGEVFHIYERFIRTGLPMYKLKDYDKEEIVGSFYEQELQAVTPGDVFKVEKVIKTRKRKGHPKEHLVRWLRWPPKYDSWVSEQDLEML